MTLVRWKRFTWELQNVPQRGSGSLPSFQIKAAAKEDERIASEVIMNALTLDYGWGDNFRSFRQMLEAQLEAAFERPTVPVMTVRHGQRIIAASVLNMEADAETHLLSGPCVLAEYRNRGIGSALLQESLQMLAAAGLTRAHGICLDRSSAEKFLYRKFGSVSEPYEFEPAALVHR
ncbi:MAG TPA: GNAT family N-acetyltransferase [Chthoniobacteraceae bacterium]|jgi:GNAT superfamily N-acetyltransferase|nr:GNAT family N-acetyltransferase [Chthoniobacteraceae bacterium]